MLASVVDTLTSYLVVSLEKAGVSTPGSTVKLESCPSGLIDPVSEQPYALKPNATNRMAAEPRPAAVSVRLM
jgi:hypothetical protein